MIGQRKNKTESELPRLVWCRCTAWHRDTRSRYSPYIRTLLRISSFFIVLFLPSHSPSLSLSHTHTLSLSTFLSLSLPTKTLAPPAIAYCTGVHPHYARCTAMSRMFSYIVIYKLLHLVLVGMHSQSPQHLSFC